jgi:hypothetical protein
LRLEGLREMFDHVWAHGGNPCDTRFVMAENPVSRTWVQQVFLPLVPGVDSLLEPLQEQAEDAQVPCTRVLRPRSDPGTIG